MTDTHIESRLRAELHEARREIELLKSENRALRHAHSDRPCCADDDEISFYTER